MRNLLIITQKIDEEDDLLGFFVDWIREFAQNFNKVFVITLAKGSYTLPDNVLVYSLGKERSTGQISRLITFYKLVFTLVPKSDGIFAHMSPIFVIASWPVTFIFRKKIIFWYLHRSLTLKLKVATLLCYKIVTAARESLNLKSNKIVEVGHGIKVEEFAIQRDWSRSHQLKIISVGRISPIKNFELLIKSADVLRSRGVDFRVEIVGRPVMAGDHNYLASLQKLVSDLRLGGQVKFVGFVPHNHIAKYYQEADICVGPLPTGGIDKAMLEAMAAGCLTLTSNTAFTKYFGHYAHKLIFEQHHINDLTEKITILFNLSSEDKKHISQFMVESVLQYHNLENLIDKISSLV